MVDRRGSYREDSDSEGSEFEENFAGLAFSDDPRTLSEIKRNRILLDRRYVFLCPTSLGKHFDVVPKQAKDGALLVFKCSREWLVRDPKEIRKKQTHARVECGVSRLAASRRSAASGRAPKSAAFSSEFSKEFMSWVLAKEKEGSIYWWKPEKDFAKLSKFLEDKMDPVNEQHYQPLLLAPHWWRVNFDRQNARFCNNPAVISGSISERSNAGIDKRDVPIHVLQELIYQSNPTLEPVAKWPYAPSMRFLPRAPSSKREFVGQYSAFKGYIDRGGTSTRCMDNTSRQEQDTRITQWPVVPRERLDDLHASWRMDDQMKATRTLPNLSSPRPPATAPQSGQRGGLFGHGFGQGMKSRHRVSFSDRSPPASAPVSSKGAREVGL